MAFHSIRDHAAAQSWNWRLVEAECEPIKRLIFSLFDGSHPFIGGRYFSMCAHDWLFPWLCMSQAHYYQTHGCWQRDRWLPLKPSGTFWAKLQIWHQPEDHKFMDIACLLPFWAIFGFTDESQAASKSHPLKQWKSEYTLVLLIMGSTVLILTGVLILKNKISNSKVQPTDEKSNNNKHPNIVQP